MALMNRWKVVNAVRGDTGTSQAIRTVALDTLNGTARTLTGTVRFVDSPPGGHDGQF
jgi:hypothetical protein